MVCPYWEHLEEDLEYAPSRDWASEWPGEEFRDLVRQRAREASKNSVVQKLKQQKGVDGQ